MTKFVARAALLLSAGAVLLLPLPAGAQVVGSIIGNVLDQNGNPLAGVQLSAGSATQIGGEKVTYSNDEGFFRFPGLQPGSFEVRASAPKLKTVVQRDVQRRRQRARRGDPGHGGRDRHRGGQGGGEGAHRQHHAPPTCRRCSTPTSSTSCPWTSAPATAASSATTSPGAANGGDWSARVRGGNLQPERLHGRRLRHDRPEDHPQLAGGDGGADRRLRRRERRLARYGGQHGDQVGLEPVRARRDLLDGAQRPVAAARGHRRQCPRPHPVPQPGRLRPHHQGQALVLPQRRGPHAAQEREQDPTGFGPPPAASTTGTGAAR